MRSTTSSADLGETIALAAERESRLWREALKRPDERSLLPVFSRLADDRFHLAIETLYEGYLAHYARPRLFDPGSGERALLLGDYLYAQALVQISALGDVRAVDDLAELIALCAHLQAEPAAVDDGPAWAAAAALIRTGTLEAARAALRSYGDSGPLAELACRAVDTAAVERALATHRRLVG